MSPSALLLGLAVAAPTLHGALVGGTVPVDVALQRLLVILLVTGLGLSAVHRLVGGFARSAAQAQTDRQGQAAIEPPGHERRRDDR